MFYDVVVRQVSLRLFLSLAAEFGQLHRAHLNADELFELTFLFHRCPCKGKSSSSNRSCPTLSPTWPISLWVLGENYAFVIRFLLECPWAVKPWTWQRCSPPAVFPSRNFIHWANVCFDEHEYLKAEVAEFLICCKFCELLQKGIKSYQIRTK